MLSKVFHSRYNGSPMRILSIETSCDETAISLLSITGSANSPRIKTLGNALFSQVKLHAKYGGVYPNLARREHGRNLIPLLKKVFDESSFVMTNFQAPKDKQAPSSKIKKIQKILEREPELLEQFLEFVPKIHKPKIDVIAVTTGPGLEPALWVGISFAKALGKFWNIPVMPINHMEGHIFSVLTNEENMKAPNHKSQITNKKTKAKSQKLEALPAQAGRSSIQYPLMALLISGGHTEIDYAIKPFQYKRLGETRDDAIGEAYDKVARMMSLPYPGGPEISKLAKRARELRMTNKKLKLPRPMLHSKDLDFSFSGLKTSVLYLINRKKLSEREKLEIAREFEEAVTEVLVLKTKKALELFPAKTLVVGGGVVANAHIRKALLKLVKNFPKTKLLFPTKELSTDNSKMIGIAAYTRLSFEKNKQKKRGVLSAKGNLRLSS